MSFTRICDRSVLTPIDQDYDLINCLVELVPLPNQTEPSGYILHAKSLKDGKEYVLKVIARKFLNETTSVRVKRECDINVSIQHKNITAVHEIYESAEDIVLIMDYLRGGDLFDKISSKTVLSEEETHSYMSQILDAVSYLHDFGIAHRDLKPENILFVSKEENSPLQILDFGFAKRLEESLITPIGTTLYVAPEVISSDVYDKSVDMWSLGCIMYFMLFGCPPFKGQTDAQIVQLAANVDYSFPTSTPNGTPINVSNAAKDLISKLLIKDSEKRLSAKQVKEHPWIKFGPKREITKPAMANTPINIDANTIQNSSSQIENGAGQNANSVSTISNFDTNHNLDQSANQNHVIHQDKSINNSLETVEQVDKETEIENSDSLSQAVNHETSTEPARPSKDVLRSSFNLAIDFAREEADNHAVEPSSPKGPSVNLVGAKDSPFWKKNVGKSKKK